MQHVSTVFRHGILVTLLVLMQSCAGPQFQPASPDAGNALLYIYEPSALLSDGEHNLVAVNEKIVAEVEPGSYFVMTIPPGRISITRKLVSTFGLLSPSAHIGLWEGFVEVESFGAKGGQRYYIRFPEGVYVEDEQRALDQLYGLKLLQPYQE
ncbi:DUF2846 domain-containing protein [Candidatus Nitronereus thalassa]|uniref:DUF2846 domain-containing protein n=1 Tax=Candidatus Nitronereus thalassa TaxID=3020898 RepID=A0ABU3K3S2_9BACT|nr:DUF2846 domain-containing protein [Candidatus Nitronereus thalassa]MDT7041039.1 DUF2846 domain-containing protein [Candidatus Nitronereus thalassa]